MAMAQTTLRPEYSAFFSSGFLAQHTPQKKKASRWDHDTFDNSPSRCSSPIPIPAILDDSLMDIDYDDRRSITPTPQTIIHTPTPSPQPVKVHPKSQQQQPSTQPRLRKRRSSLTQASSPMNAIRSPARTASNALHLQLQLHTALSPSRSRSRSVTKEDVTVPRYTNVGVASSETSLAGRMRSGSLGQAPPLPVALRRRPIRRQHIAVLQAPIAPPPTIPLPALPFNQPHFRPSNMNAPTCTAQAKTSSFSTVCVSATSARARGLSVSNSALDGEADRIDEEMKEN